MTPKRTRLFITGLVLLYIVSVLINLGLLELAGEEPRRAVISLEMLHSGNFISPTLFGWDYYNKPVVFNWVLSGMMFLTGSSSEFVLRLPSLLFYLFWAFCHYKISTHFCPKRLALLSSFFMLVSVDIYFYGLGNGAEMDIFYSFVVYLQVVSIFIFYQWQQWAKLYVYSYLFCAIGFLTKGFPSLLFQGLTLASLCFYAGTAKVLLKRSHVFGILVLGLVVGVYFLAYSAYNPPLRMLVNLLNESVIKSAIGERSNKLVEKSIGYPLMFLKLLTPWSLLLLLLFKKNIRSGLLQNPFVKFSLLFIAFNLWVYWFTGQPKGRYVYMFIPFAIVVLTAIYEKAYNLYQLKIDKVLGYAGYLFAIIGCAVIALSFFTNTSYPLAIGLAIVFFVFVFFYFRITTERIWPFVLGIIFSRIAYALLVIPLQYDATVNYNKNMASALESIGEQPLQYWAPPDSLTIKVQSKLVNFPFETLTAPPHLYAQVPYYYYRHTGRLLKYDTTIKKDHAYLSFERYVKDLSIQPMYKFESEIQSGGIIIFNLKQTQSALRVQ